MAGVTGLLVVVIVVGLVGMVGSGAGFFCIAIFEISEVAVGGL